MKAPSKRQLENEVKTFVVERALGQLEKMRRSKFYPAGGFRQGYGFSHKIYGYRDIIAVSARFFTEEDLSKGRLMINTRNEDWRFIEKQFDRIIKLLDKYQDEGIRFEYEHDAAGGTSFWFKWWID